MDLLEWALRRAGLGHGLAALAHHVGGPEEDGGGGVGGGGGWGIGVSARGGLRGYGEALDRAIARVRRRADAMVRTIYQRGAFRSSCPSSLSTL